MYEPYLTRPNVNTIRIDIVANAYGVSKEHIFKSQNRKHKEAKFVIYYVLHSLEYTQQEIADTFQISDRTSVSYGVNKIKKLMEAYPDFKIQIENILNQYKSCQE
jgi:chromosomal replication initiation ATPase DnaA